MARTQALVGIVLQVHDVGEADRFCVFFSKERGRLTVRARGARKTGSKLAAATMPLQEVRLQVAESSNTLHINSADVVQSIIPKSASELCVLYYAVELIQHLTHDDEPLPEIYVLLQEIIRYADSRQTLLPFTIRLLHLLGVMANDAQALEPVLAKAEDRTYVQRCASKAWLEVQESASNAVSRLCEKLLQEQTGRMWKVPDVLRQLRGSTA